MNKFHIVESKNKPVLDEPIVFSVLGSISNNQDGMGEKTGRAHGLLKDAI